MEEDHLTIKIDNSSVLCDAYIHLNYLKFLKVHFHKKIIVQYNYFAISFGMLFHPTT